MNNPVLRVALIGPESSGKSELCAGLATNYNTNWVPEYAREYLQKLVTPYSLEDIVNIYITQFEQEKEMLKSSNRLLFTDTEFIIAKVWCEYAFGTCPDLITNAIIQHPYDLYLLTAPDLPWEYDPLRENPGKGEFFFNWYQQILNKHNFNYAIVEGKGLSRLQNAILLVEDLLNKTDRK